ncbi:unnamed protein product [Paramecium octaurelia]|uniref:Purple acid phosphatase n=1 Tax=Paramecium octaurelia TaxID=43137 RepID=A0A8S1XLZ1_PAROT|nr:unnamed protein product [Paramecium octaurelia]
MILLIISLLTLANSDCIPYGVRQSLGHYYSALNDINNYITLTFNSQNLCLDYVVQIITATSINNIQVTNFSLLNMTDVYKDSENVIHYETYVYDVKIGQFDSLIEGNQYTFVIYWENALIAGPFYFNVPSKSLNYSSKFIVMGDMDSNWKLNTSKQTFDWFTNQIKKTTHYDGIIYLGDMAYDLEDDNCMVGDNFLRNISLFTSHFPFMLTLGNHDSGHNDEFVYIRKSFATPRISEYDNAIKYNDFYSFQVGHAYFVQFHPYKIAYGNDDKTYFNYTLFQMEQELSRIRQHENTSWLIVYNHYPFYCSNPDDGFCEDHYKKMQLFEDLFIKYHVDLCLAGHQHTYERDEPLAYNKVAQFDKYENNTYTNPKAPIYIVEGAAGNDEIMPEDIYPPKFYTKFQAAGDGIGILEVKNKTHLYFEHRMSANDSVVDYVWIVKTNVVPDDDDDKVKDSIPIWVWILVGVGVLLIIALVSYCVIKNKKQQKTHNEFI